MLEIILFILSAVLLSAVILYISLKFDIYEGEQIKFLYSFSIRKRLMLINIAFIVPLSILLFFVISNINKNIDFSTLEVRGNVHQRILMPLLTAAIEKKYNYFAEKGTVFENTASVNIENIYKKLEEYDNLYGEDLKIDDKAFEKQNKSYLSVRSLREEWQKLEALGNGVHDDNLAKGYDVYINHIFELISYVGNSSNLILDPDLDSYYTMNVTLVAIPNLFNRLSNIINIEHSSSDDDTGAIRIEVLTQARLLGEDISHINKSIHTALIEDANFYGENTGFKTVIPPALKDFETAIQKLITQLSTAYSTGKYRVDSYNHNKDAISASVHLWEIASTELNDFLSMRIDSFKNYQRQVLIWTSISVLFAFILFWFLTGSITRPIINLQKVMTVIADDTQKVTVPYQQYHDEIGMMARAVEWFRILQNIVSKQNRDLIDAKDKAEKATLAKGNFLANMSHELRTPMNGVLGMASLLADTPLNDEQKEFVLTINGSAENLLMLLNDILDFSKIEAGALVLENIAFDFVDALQKTINLLRPQAVKKGIELIMNCDPNIPAYVWGDSGRIRQIIINLLGNAIKFTEYGYVRLHANIQTDNNGDTKFLINVEDTGMGIPANKLEEIFDKFTQADASVTRKYGGTGLGLAICEQLVNLMGGEIGVNSTEGKGSTFWFTIPCKAAEEKDTYAQNEQKRRRSQVIKNMIPIKDAKVLLVEDYYVNQIFAKKLLHKLGFNHIDLVENGVQAIEKYHIQKYDMIFMDCQMPELDGYQTTQKLRMLEEGTFLHTPIVAMTANAMMGDREKCLKAGMDDYLSKPLSAEHLKTIIEMWFLLDNEKAVLSVPKSNITTSQVTEEVPVDLEQLRMFTDGDPEEEKALANLFLEQAKEMIAILEKSMGADKQDAWKSAAHRFKGSSGNLGATKLHNLCKEAEANFMDNESKKVKMLAAIKNETKRVEVFFG